MEKDSEVTHPYATRSATRRESARLEVENISTIDESEAANVNGREARVTAESPDPTPDANLTESEEMDCDRPAEAMPSALNESMIEFRLTCASQLERLRNIDQEMVDGIKQLEFNVANMTGADDSDLSDLDEASSCNIRRNRSSTPTRLEADQQGNRRRTPSPAFSDISSIAPYNPAALAPVRYEHDEEDRQEQARRATYLQAVNHHNARLLEEEHHEQQRAWRAQDDAIQQAQAEIDATKQKYHEERSHTLDSLGQTIDIGARQQQHLQRINMLTNRATTIKQRVNTRCQERASQAAPPVNAERRNRQHPPRADQGAPVRSTAPPPEPQIRIPPRAVRPNTLPLRGSSIPPSRSRALVAWPLNQSLVSREGSNPNSTAGVHDSEARGTRFRGTRRRQHDGGGYPSDSSEDDSSDNSSSGDEGRGHNAPRKRYNRNTKRVELKPNCFNGKNWPSYRLHFLSCVEGNSWSKKMAVKVLKTKLVDDAAYVLQQRQNGVWSLKGLLGALDCRYSQVGGPNYLIRQALHYAHQNSSESLQHYVDRIMSIVWGKLNDQELEDQLALDQFLVGVIDPELQQFLGEQPRMKSLFDALKMARDWELSEQHTQDRKAKIKASGARHEPPATPNSDDRVNLMKQLEREKERNKQLQINAEVDRRLRHQEAPRPNNIRNQHVRFDNPPRSTQQPYQEQHQPQQHFHGTAAPNQNNYNRPPAPRGNFEPGRGGYRNNAPPRYQGYYNPNNQPGGNRPSGPPQEERRGFPPGQAQGPPGETQRSA